MIDLTTAHATSEGRIAGPCTELAAILASTRDAVVVSTALGVIETWNAAAEELYGYAAEEIVGRHVEVLVEPARREQEAMLLRRVVRGEPLGEHRTSRVAKDGSVVAVSLTTSAIVDTADGTVGAVTVSRRLGERPATRDRSDADADEHRLAGAGIAVRDAQLQQAQRMEVLGRLAGGVAHDFNNLLAVILNYASFVAEQLTAEAGAAPDWEQRRQVAERDVGQIQHAAERATDLTRQLLAFARREVVQPQVLDLNDAMAGVEELLRRALRESIDLVINQPDGLWPILADPGQIEQILVNLAINASDAMPDGGMLRIDTANIDVDADSVAGGSPVRPGRYVRLRVSDTGDGMSAEVIAHAFEPFYTTKGAGTGLGLATVYGIVAQTEGTITIQSELGEGTTFTIMVPVTEELGVPLAEPASYHRIPEGETVLVVEDEAALREVTERIFSRNGYRVITAAHGPDAIALAASHAGEIHLLVTDVVMPHMLGKEVADRIRELRPDIEVLFMSGYAQPVLASQGRLEPGVALIDKPFSETELLAKAGQVLNGHFRGFTTVLT